MHSLEEKIRKICADFRLEGELASFDEIKMGNVNRTYLVRIRNAQGQEKPYMLQAVNTYVFRDPEGVMENIEHVTAHIKQKQMKT